MQMLMSIAIVVQIIAAIAVIILVLLQHGKGADLGAAFGSGASGSLFGATGSANFLSRSTAVAATIFFCATIAITPRLWCFQQAESAASRRSARYGDDRTDDAGSRCRRLRSACCEG